MIKITGLDKLRRNVDDAQAALAPLDGELGAVRFDPNDPASIDAAILSVEQTIDERVGPYADNAIVAPIAKQMKERFTQAILDKAAAARLDLGKT